MFFYKLAELIFQKYIWPNCRNLNLKKKSWRELERLLGQQNHENLGGLLRLRKTVLSGLL